MVSLTDADGDEIERMEYDIYGRLTDFEYWNGSSFTAATENDGMATTSTY